MYKAWILATKELRTFFNSLMAYVLLVIFLGFSGFFTWMFGPDVFFRNQASLDVFFSVALWVLLFFIPALTMRSFSEERRTGTLEWLFSKSISDTQIVIGKFLSIWIMIALALACTLPYYITVANLGNIDHGAVLGGYAGLLLVSMAYIGLGLFASSITNNQIVAFLLGLFVMVFFHFLFALMASNLGGTIGRLFYFLSIPTHYKSIARGVVDMRDLVYFLSIACLGLFFAPLTLKQIRQ